MPPLPRRSRRTAVTRRRAVLAIRSRAAGGISAAARMRATATVSSIRVLSRTAVRNGDAGGKGAVNTISISAFSRMPLFLLSPIRQIILLTPAAGRGCLDVVRRPWVEAARPRGFGSGKRGWVSLAPRAPNPHTIASIKLCAVVAGDMNEFCTRQILPVFAVGGEHSRFPIGARAQTNPAAATKTSVPRYLVYFDEFSAYLSPQIKVDHRARGKAGQGGGHQDRSPSRRGRAPPAPCKPTNIWR